METKGLLQQQNLFILKNHWQAGISSLSYCKVQKNLASFSSGFVPRNYSFSLVIIRLHLESRIPGLFPAFLTRCFLCEFVQPAGCVGRYLWGNLVWARTVSLAIYCVTKRTGNIFALFWKRLSRKILKFTLITCIYRGSAHLGPYLKVQVIHLPSFSGITLERNKYLTFGEGIVHLILCTVEL